MVGAALGFIFLLPLRFFKKAGNRLSLIVAFVFAGIGIATLFDLSSLLLCMAMGAVVANFSPDVTQIMDICDGVTPPIFLLFFVASGAGPQAVCAADGRPHWRDLHRAASGRQGLRALRLAASCASVTRT